MAQKAVYVLLVEGFADWEPAHALAELRRHGQYRVEAVGLTRDPVTSMGGLRIVPSRRIADVDPDDVAVFILPGGERWERVPMELELESVLKCLDERQIPIAAICAATVAVARVGLLRGRRHTSNGLSYSASGLADLEFARELFEELGVLSQGDRALWAEMFRTARLPGSQT